MQRHDPQSSLTVEHIDTFFDELPGALSIESSSSSDWFTISYRDEPIARYLPPHEIAELEVHLVVDETEHGDNQPREVTEALIKALSDIKAQEFEICHHDAESIRDDQYRQILVLRHGSIAEAEFVELISPVLEASRYAIDLVTDEGVAQNGPD